MKKSFSLFYDSLDVLDDLTDEQAGQLFKAIRAYEIDGEEVLTGILKAVFNQFKTHLDRNKEIYNKKVKAGKANGRRGGRPTEKGKQNQKKVEKGKPNQEKVDTPLTETETETETETKEHNTHEKTFSDFDYFILEVEELFKKSKILVFKNKINATVAKPHFDKNSDYKQIAFSYAEYIKRNKSKGVRLDKYLIAYRENSLQDIEYGQDKPQPTYRKPQPQKGSIGWMRQQAELESESVIDVEALGD